MHPMFKNWNPRNQAQVNNTIRLAMAECPDDVPEIIEIAKKKGFTVPSGLTPATGWGSFESKSRKKNCSMQKKIESLRKNKKNEDASLEVACDNALKASNFEDNYWAWTRAEADKITDKVLEENPDLDYVEVWIYVREHIIEFIYDNCKPAL